MLESAVVAVHVQVLVEACRQTQLLGDLRRSEPGIHQAHSLVVQVAVDITLRSEKRLDVVLPHTGQ